MSSVKNEDNKLPDGWVLCQSKSIPGRKYYFNKKTGKSSWSQPQEDGKSDKKKCKRERHRRSEKRKREEQAKKGIKRKSDSHEDNASKKRTKHDTSGSLANTSKRSFTSHSEQKRNESPKHTSTPKTTPSKSFSKNETPMKQSPVKNLANTRLSQLRALLNSEAKDEEDPDLPKKSKISPKCNETNKRNDKSPSFNDSKSTQSPSSDSLQSIPSPSQFFAANKIISSMKAQLPEEYCSKEKQKDTFADIEKGICSQTTEYPFSKHPATPPQFSEASKLMSAIKSKLAYKGSTSKDIKQFSSAKDRMENIRMSLSLETDKELNSSCSFLSKSEISCKLDTEDSKNTSEAMEVEDFREIKPKSPPIQRDNIGDGENLMLVVDTNIFIYDLHFIKHVLNSHIKGYSEPPTLLIPWRVINELDRLKDNNNGNGVLCKRAKAAMDYLYKSLPENNRIKGQSLRDANSHIYPCEVPDDEILNCTLQQVERGKNVILVSNDKNLCTKATINGVKRIDVHELKKLIENKPQVSNTDLSTNVKCYQQNMYRLLANILENEMRAKYNNLWQHVLFKAPPWSLMDVVQCLLKHWMAVFSEVFPRIESIIIDLKNSLTVLENKDANTLTPSEVTNFKELCLDIARKCQIIPEYMDLAKITVEKLLKNNGEELPLEPNYGRNNDIQGRLNNESHGNLNVEHQERNEGQVGKEVVEAFEGMWTVLSSYCAKLSTVLGIEHTIDDKLPGNEPLSTLTSKWDEYSAHVNDLVCAIDGVLNTENSSAHIQRLAKVLKDVSGVVGTTPLTSFCLNCRNMLQEAHSKFSQLSELLNLCKSRFSNDVN